MRVLDETDSGLDIDALKTVAHGVNSLRGPDLGILLITHYQRLLNYIVPDHVHVMVAGRIVRSGAERTRSRARREVTIGRATVRLNQHIGNNGGQIHNEDQKLLQSILIETRRLFLS